MEKPAVTLSRCANLVVLVALAALVPTLAAVAQDAYPPRDGGGDVLPVEVQQPGGAEQPTQVGQPGGAEQPTQVEQPGAVEQPGGQPAPAQEGAADAQPEPVLPRSAEDQARSLPITGADVLRAAGLAALALLLGAAMVRLAARQRRGAGG